MTENGFYNKRLKSVKLFIYIYVLLFHLLLTRVVTYLYCDIIELTTRGMIQTEQTLLNKQHYNK